MNDKKKHGFGDFALIVGIALVILYFYSKTKGQ